VEKNTANTDNEPVMKALSVILILSICACPIVYNHFVRFNVAHEPGVVYNFTFAPEEPDTIFNWISRIFGIPVNPSAIQPLYGDTDTNGVVDVPLFPTVRYNVTVFNTENVSDTHSFVIYPRESEYVIYW
jgi:hypothetical protein